MGRRRRSRAAWPFYLAVWALGTAAALYWGYGVLWAASLCLAAVLACDGLAFLWSLLTLRVDQWLDQPAVAAGDNAYVGVRCRGGGFWRPQVTAYWLEAPWDGRSKQQAVIDCPGSGWIKVYTRFMGPLCCGAEQVRVSSPLGFFAKRISLLGRGYPQRLLALPAVRRLPLADGSQVQGETSAEEGPATGDPDTVSGTRPYAYGDPLHRVNWKKTASMGKLYIKEFDGPSEGVGAEVLLGSWESDLETRQIAAEYVLSALAHYWEGGCERVRLYGLDGDQWREVEPGMLDGLRRELCAFAPAEPPSGRLRDLPQGGGLPQAIVLTGALQPGERAGLAAMPSGSMALCCGVAGKGRAVSGEGAAAILCCKEIGDMRCVDMV